MTNKISKNLGTLVLGVGMTLGSFKGVSQDYINYSHYNEINSIFYYSIFNYNNPTLKYKQGENTIEEFHEKKGKLIYKQYKNGNTDTEIYNKRKKLIYKHEDPKKERDIDTIQNNMESLEMFNQNKIL